MDEIFQVDSEIVKKNFADRANYKIIYNASAPRRTAAVYFSSNGLYFPNTEEEFKKMVLDKDRYEWEKNLIPDCHKHIFIRDLKKQWYLNGINKEIDSLEKMESFLKNEVAGYEEVITTGCSSGGFISVLIGIKLKATKIFSFNGQFDISFLLNESACAQENPIIFRQAREEKIKESLNLEKYIKDFSSDIFYFSSLYSDTDQRQIAIAKKYDNIIKVCFKESKHGLPFDPYLLTRIISLKKERLKKLSEKKWTRDEFSREIIGITKTFYRIRWKQMEFYLKSLLQKIKN